MKKLIITLCCVTSVQYCTYAQNILSLQTASIGGATAILPNYDNIFKLLRATRDDFLATMKNFHYVQSKPDDPNTYMASNTDQVYNVDKEEKNLDIFFSDNGGYAKSVKDDFLARYPNARHKTMNDGIEAYYFDTDEGGSKGHYCMFFDLPADGGGGVTLLSID